LVTGIASIDEQHRVLVDMCNQAHSLLRVHSTTDSIKRIVRDLMSYALYHFEEEEELAVTSGYRAERSEEFAHHRSQHQAFASTVADMQARLLHGNEISVQVLFDFLRNWLIQHIQGTDIQLAHYINDRVQSRLTPTQKAVLAFQDFSTLP
jgi:hemerythrin-like metal-binding protein